MKPAATASRTRPTHQLAAVPTYRSTWSLVAVDEGGFVSCSCSRAGKNPAMVSSPPEIARSAPTMMRMSNSRASTLRFNRVVLAWSRDSFRQLVENHIEHDNKREHHRGERNRLEVPRLPGGLGIGKNRHLGFRVHESDQLLARLRRRHRAYRDADDDVDEERGRRRDERHALSRQVDDPDFG